MHGHRDMKTRTTLLPWSLAAGALLAATGVSGCGNTPPRGASDESTKRDDATEQMHEAAVVLREVTMMADSVPPDLRRDARCIAIVPAIVKAAFVFGAQYGRGMASCRTGITWTAPAFFDVGGGSFGAQVGYQSTDLVLYVMNDSGMRKLLSSKVALGAGMSVAAGPVGRDASASTDWKLRAEILAYSRSRGLFAGIDLGGAVIVQDRDRTRAVYGVDQDYRALLEGRVGWPASGAELLSVLSRSDGPPQAPAASSR